MSTVHKAVNNYFPESDDYLYFVSALICCIAVNILGIIQIKNVYLDLCTKERKSVAHRNSIPTATRLYKAVNIMTWFSVFCYGMTGVLECIKQGPSGNCKTEFYIVMLFFNWSKASLFSVYLLRLSSTYGGSSYAYPEWIIYGLVAIQWIFGIILPIICNIYTEIFVYDEDGFPDPCWGVFSQWNVVWIITWDFVMNFGCLIAFIIPLYKTLNDINNNKAKQTNACINSVVESSRQNMKNIAIKITILTATGSITTIIGLTVFEAFTFAHILPYDWIVNSICLILMTPYYPDNKYFNRLCGICIHCCCSQYTHTVSRELQSVQQTHATSAAPDPVQVPPIHSSPAINPIRIVSESVQSVDI